MDTRKSQTKIQPNPTGNVIISKLEERLERLENVSHKPCGGTSQVV